MSLGEMNACLARLYVDEPFRKLFWLDPDSTLADYALDSAERNAVRSLDQNMLEYFAASLKHKRMKRIERAFPLLFSLDRATVERIYSRFHQLYKLRAGHAVHQDALDFGEFAEASLPDMPGMLACAADVARFERLYYACTYAESDAADTLSGPPFEVPGARPRLADGVTIASFEHDVVAIEEAIDDGRLPDVATIKPAACSIIFRPATAISVRQMLRINTPTRAILERCDGCHNVAQIVAESEEALDASDLEAGIVDVIRRLFELGVLVAAEAKPLEAQHATYYPESF